MDNTVKAELLAEAIHNERIAEIKDEFYQEVSEKTYQKYYGHNGSQNPYLSESKHGGYWFEDTNGEKHYYMLRRKYYSMKKKKYKSGKVVYRPDRAEMASRYKEAKRYLSLAEKQGIAIYKDWTNIVVKLPYGKMPSEYAHSRITSTYQYGVDKGLYTVQKSGKMNSVDRLILRSIQKWCTKNGITCVIDGKGREDI